MFVVKERISGIDEQWETVIGKFAVEADAFELEAVFLRTGHDVWVEEITD